MTIKTTHSLKSLAWLPDELDTSLGLAREALLAYRADPEDSSQLSFALGYLHQVSGSLTMAQCYGAVLLAKEMETTLKMLLSGSSASREDTCEVLELTMLALPNYVRSLLDGCDNTLVQLMERINELRAVRAEPFISLTPLFMPKMPAFDPDIVERSGNCSVLDKDMLGKLQKVYQYALLGYLKLRDLDSNQKKIAAVLRRLQSDFSSEPLAPLWRVANGFFAALVANTISQSPATRSLLWELDKILRRLLGSEKPGLEHQALLRNLLYYIALAPGDSPTLDAIKNEFSLDQAFPSLVLTQREGAVHTHLEGAVVTALSDSLGDEITALVSIVDSFEEGDQSKLNEARLSIERLATTLMVVGQIKLSQSLQNEAEALDQATPNLPMVGTHLQSIQRSLQAWALNYSDMPLASDLLSETAYVVDDAQRSLIREVRNNFESIKESIVGYIASQWDGQFLQEIPGQFEHIFGAVEVIGLKRVGLIVEQLGHYISSQLLRSEQPPEWSDLDALADAITGFEYYLEAIDKGREGEQSEMLRRTAEAMEKLGFTIGLETETAPEVEPSVLATELNDQEALPRSERSDSKDDDELDPEIKAIFIEEAQEVLAALETNYPIWLQDLSDEKILNELRRGFHTLKGSGRMVNATVIGDLAWSLENMFNKILDKSPCAIPAETAELIDISLALIPSLVDDFERGYLHLSPYCASLINAVEMLTKGEPVTLPQKKESVEREDLMEPAIDLSEPIRSGPAEALDKPEDVAEVEPVVQIFVGEAGQYVKTLANFLNDFQQPVEGSRLAPADVHRALHTLQASAGMAGFVAVSELAGTLEDFIVVLFARGQTVSSRIIALLMNGVDRLRDTLIRLEAGGGEDRISLNEYRSHLELTRAQWQEENATGNVPKGLAALQQLIVTGLENVLLADSLLDQWFTQSTFNRQAVGPLTNELIELGTAAESLGVSSLSVLCDELSGALSHLASLGQGIDDDALAVFKAAHEQILSMIDIVAIGQPVTPAPAELLIQLQAQRARELPVEALGAVNVPEVPQQAIQELARSDDLASRMAGEVHDPDVIPFFLEEVDDLLEGIENALQTWRNEPGDIGQGERLNRLLHTLKGSARLAGLSLLGDLSHDLEALILEEEGQLARGDEVVFDRLFTRYDELLAVLDWVKSGGDVALEQVPLAEEPAAPEINIEPEITLEVVQSPLRVEESSESVADDSALATEGPASRDDLASRMADEEHDPDVIPFFLEEADDLLEGIENALQAWRNEPGDISQGELLNRFLHTLKGSARLAGLSLLGDLSHDLEALILEEEGQLAKGDETVFDRLFARYDELLAVLDWVKSGGAVVVEEKPFEEAPVPETQIATGTESGPEAREHLKSPASPEVSDEKPRESELPELTGTGVKPNAEPESVADQRPAVMGASEVPAQVAARPKPAVAMQESIKIPAQVLDNLVNLAGEASIARGRVEQGVGESASALNEMEETIARLRLQVRQLGRQTEAQIQFRREQIESSESAGFDPLELDRYSQLQELSRGLEESGSDLQDLKGTLLEKSQIVEGLLLMQSRITQDLQENLMKTRLVPFSRLVPRLRRIVRQVSQELGKQVNLSLNNIEGEMDRSVLEKIITPIEHMLRNAMDHGIEPAEERLVAGKPGEGNISLSFRREGGEVVITVADDGKGLDVAAIRDKAIGKKLIAADTEATDSELLRLIFQPGFSTAATVSQVSGRGVGMDVVKTEVHQLGGSISIESELGFGVEFTIRLPFTVSVNKALLVKDGDRVYALPLGSIVGVTQLEAKEINDFYTQPHKRLEYGGVSYEVCQFGRLLHAGQVAPSTESGKVALVLVEADNRRYAVHVDAIEGHQEIIVKGLGSQFSNVPGVAGATILASGKVVVILDLPSLLRSMGERVLLERADKKGARISSDSFEHGIGDLGTKTIMVVDDSVTVRKVTSRLLEREGFAVTTAKDGVEATEILAEVKPDLMLLDIEMPRMDGFEVARVVRSSEEFSQLPIIMISSRTGEKHQQRARDIGVNEFLGKPYQEDQLLNLLDELLDFGFA
jgi:chemosensory pili system protein ChpA (sensor histidine kinase/response regulator)